VLGDVSEAKHSNACRFGKGILRGCFPSRRHGRGEKLSRTVQKFPPFLVFSAINLAAREPALEDVEGSLLSGTELPSKARRAQCPSDCQNCNDQEEYHHDRPHNHSTPPGRAAIPPTVHHDCDLPYSVVAIIVMIANDSP
jgi:hypothetical protein